MFAIWEYDSYEQYKEIESKIRNDEKYIRKIHEWYEKHGEENMFYRVHSRDEKRRVSMYCKVIER